MAQAIILVYTVGQVAAEQLGGTSSSHWAYQRPVRSDLPKVADQEWPANAIDYFVLARLEQSDLRPSKRAKRGKLLRRLYLDLIGIPPSVEQLEAFLRNDAPDAYQREVDRLTASPHYGEKWARQWLDLARYADSNGFQADQLRDSWAYRDWVIQAMNADMPFDRFTVEQIAGDLLPNPTIAQRIATGFHRTPPCNVEAGVDPEENRTNQVIDRVNTTGTVWLGSTFACAQCHDHEYDPLTQKEYFQFLAFFNNTPIEVELGDGAVRYDFVGPMMDLPLAETQTTRQKGLKQRLAIAEKRLAACVDEGEVKSLKAQVQQLKSKLDGIQPSSTLVMVEMPRRRETHVFVRGDFLNKGARVEPSTPSFLPPMVAGASAHRLVKLEIVSPRRLRQNLDRSQSSGHPNSGEVGYQNALSQIPRNRLGLAYWLVDPRNPLVGRVTVNHWWTEIFGNGIVRTGEDFGTQGEPPTHPQLLDWLALKLVDDAWSMKDLIRRMVRSATYQQSSRVEPEKLEVDPDNRLLSRGPRFRLTAEFLRDNALAIGGLLSTRLGGAPAFPPQPPNLWRQIGRNEPKYVVATDENRVRRGVYVIWRRAAPYPSFVNFDAPDRASCVVQRSRTNTPLQALTLMNDTVYVESAKALAARLTLGLPATASPAERVTYGFQLCTARRPNGVELDHLLEVYFEHRNRLSQDEDAAHKLIGDFRLPRNSETPSDMKEWASWFYVANILLNLDETITKG